MATESHVFFGSEEILPPSPPHINLAMDAMQCILHKYYMFAVCCLESDGLQFLNTFFANTVIIWCSVELLQYIG
jgi:hypothetical protein